jgi:RNA polymerase sigma-70 factor (ECF subfamily)
MILQIQATNDSAAWSRFVTLYQPVIERIAMARGLQHADALDVTQTILTSVIAAIPRWEKREGESRFRHWLRRVCRNAICNMLSRQPLDCGTGGNAARDVLDECPCNDAALDDLFETEYRREVFRIAAKVIRREFAPKTWQAFELTVVEDRSIAQVSGELAMSVGSIYAARSRITRRLREAIQEIEGSDS